MGRGWIDNGQTDKTPESKSTRPSLKLSMSHCLSYFQLSKVAGVSDDVIELAERMAGDMEHRQKAFLEFRRAFAV